MIVIKVETVTLLKELRAGEVPRLRAWPTGTGLESRSGQKAEPAELPGPQSRFPPSTGARPPRRRDRGPHLIPEACSGGAPRTLRPSVQPAPFDGRDTQGVHACGGRRGGPERGDVAFPLTDKVRKMNRQEKSGKPARSRAPLFLLLLILREIHVT